MQRDELERLSKAELIELVLRLQRPAKTSRASSKPPSTDPKERRAHARPGGAKAGHEGHSRALSPEADRVVDHAPPQCPCCRLALSPDLPSEAVSVHERIELPEIKPLIEQAADKSGFCCRWPFCTPSRSLGLAGEVTQSAVRPLQQRAAARR